MAACKHNHNLSILKMHLVLHDFSNFRFAWHMQHSCIDGNGNAA